MPLFALFAQAPRDVGPQPGTPEHQVEMQQWEEVNDRIASAGVLVGA